MKRRDFILSGLAIAGSACSPLPNQFIGNTKNINVITGISSGEASVDGAIIWSRCDRPAIMHVEVSSDPLFHHTTQFTGGSALAPTDYNAKTILSGLLPGQTWYYRVFFEDLVTRGIFSAKVAGKFKTTPTLKDNIRFCWSGDTAGQGYGIDPSRDGMLTYCAILEQQPDFFIHCGDLIYADGPISATKTLTDGTVWRNIQHNSVSKVAESIQEFRERYYYNFLDQHLAALHRNVVTYQQWDDHEVKNNWYPGQIIDDSRYKYTEVTWLAEHSKKAMQDCNPISFGFTQKQLYRQIEYGPLLDIFMLDMRSFRGPNTDNLETKKTHFLGNTQLLWLKNALQQSKATWKIIAADMPIGVKVTDWGTNIADNMANIDGPPLGRELEFVDLLSFIKDNDIDNVHFITADVHYCASHFYDPNKAQYTHFKPFWEFVSGPLHAGTFSSNGMDNTFGPQVVFCGVPDDLEPSSPPSDNYQFFGQIDIDGVTEELHVSHYNRQGIKLWSTKLQPLG